MDKCCVIALVVGKVQGVGFRWAAREQALKHGVTGHARNLPDGRVEVLICGERDAVTLLSEWLWKGPPHAHVTHVELEVVEAHDRDDFRTL